MSNRHTAYLSALKYHFQYQILRWNLPRRRAYAFAKRYAAEYAFRISEDNLRHVTLFGFVNCI